MHSMRTAATVARRAAIAVTTAPSPVPTATLVLLDDHRLLHEGLAVLLRTQPGFRVLSADPGRDDGVSAVRDARPDVVLLDAGMGRAHSLSLAAALHDAVPATKVIITGLQPADADVAAFVRAGARGFVLRQSTFADFMATLREVLAGRQVLPQELASALFAQLSQPGPAAASPLPPACRALTIREREVVTLLGEGLSNKGIAQRLHIAVHTVKSHVHHVLAKLALHSRLEVAALLQNGSAPHRSD